MSVPFSRPSAAAAPAEEPRPRPRSCSELFCVFNRLSLQGFGGVLAVAQRELVDRARWLTREEFVELLSVGQVLPGPNIVNLALMLGERFFGLRGAIVALLGLLTVPLVIVLTLAALLGQFAQHPQVAGALRGIGAVAAGLVLAMAFRLAESLRRSPLGLPVAGGLAALTLLLVAGLRWPLPAVIAVLGTPGMLMAWRRLKR